MDALAELTDKEKRNAEMIDKAAKHNLRCIVCGIPSGVFNKKTGKGVTLYKVEQKGFTGKYMCRECKDKIEAVKQQ